MWLSRSQWLAGRLLWILLGLIEVESQAVSFREVFFGRNPLISDVRLVDPASRKTLQSLVELNSVDLAMVGKSLVIEIDVVEYSFWPLGFVAVDYSYNQGDFKWSMHLAEKPYTVPATSTNQFGETTILPIAQPGFHQLTASVVDPENQTLETKEISWIVVESQPNLVLALPEQTPQPASPMLRGSATVYPTPILPNQAQTLSPTPKAAPLSAAPYTPWSSSNSGFTNGALSILPPPSHSPTIVDSFAPVATVATNPPLRETQAPTDRTTSAPMLPTPSPSPTILESLPGTVSTDPPLRETQAPIDLTTTAPTLEPSTSVPTSLAPSLSPTPESMLSRVLLYDCTTHHPLMTVRNNEVISLEATRTSMLTLLAEPKHPVTFVKFIYDNSTRTRTEYVAPYAMGGDFGDQYHTVDWLSLPGEKVVQFEIGMANATLPSIVETLRFTVVETSPTASPGKDNTAATVEVAPTLSPITAVLAPAPNYPMTTPQPTMLLVTTKAPVAPVTSSSVRFIDLDPPTEEIFAADGPKLQMPLVDGVTLAGETKKWHKLTLVFDGPYVSETSDPNPFTDFRLDVSFRNEQSGEEFLVPGYFAADGDAANSSADSGSKWHCHFIAPSTGRWTWEVRFISGPNVAMQWPKDATGTPVSFNGKHGTFVVGETDKKGRDLRGKGLLRYVGQHHLQFAETGEWFLKCGSDSPENFLAYDDIDNTGIRSWSMKSWEPHQKDYRPGDPTWGDGKGTEIIGAVNYLADQAMNAFSFLTFSLEGDDKNVYPYISDTEFARMDVSKLAQWEIIFEHADRRGMFMHFKTQETENDEILDGGELGDYRKLYYRELIARFGHHLALNWNIGEENTNTDAQRKSFADWFEALDPYKHPVVVHTYIGDQDDVYEPLYGYPSYDGASVQTWWDNVFRDTLARVRESAAAGRPWIVSNDEQADAQDGVVPDSIDPEHYKIRSQVLWGNIMAGGAGVEYYFGYGHENSDLTAQDLRSRANMWKQSRYALEFFSKFTVPFQNMSNRNSLVSDPNWCLAERGDHSSVFVIYIPSGGTSSIDLSNVATVSKLTVRWYDPRNGGDLQVGSKSELPAGFVDTMIGDPPGSKESDWVVLMVGFGDKLRMDCDQNSHNLSTSEPQIQTLLPVAPR